MDIFFDSVGLVGVGLILLAYFLLQMGKCASHHLAYPVMNLVGAVLLLISLWWSWNLPSVIIEICWIVISIIGIIKICRKK